MIDLTNKTFGRLKVIKRGTTHIRPNGTHSVYWVCECECGNTKEICGSSLRNGMTISCGCYRREKSPLNGTKHGMARTRLYNIWKQMKKRCYNAHTLNYSDYGGRGISVCDEWRENFDSFYNWALKNGYSENLSIDRINVDNNYCPGNCRWADATTQQNNKRNNRYVEYRGEKKTVTEWAKELNISRDAIYRGLKKGLSFEEIVCRRQAVV